MPRVVIIADQNGGVKIDAQEFVGATCQDATKAFEAAYASKKRTENLKSEFWEAEKATSGNVKAGW